jgi:hypothetical protein
MIVPIIHGCTIQKYGTSPTVSGVHVYSLPAIARPESNSPVGPSVGVPAVNVCAALSGFENVTTPPTSTVAVPGM